jgi:hypothetical protein
MSAAQSGLAQASSVPSALATTTWSDLHRRQQRLVSGLGEAERRIATVTAKLERLGWDNPNKRGPQMQVGFMQTHHWAPLNSAMGTRGEPPPPMVWPPLIARLPLPCV